MRRMSFIPAANCPTSSIDAGDRTDHRLGAQLTNDRAEMFEIPYFDIDQHIAEIRRFSGHRD